MVFALYSESMEIQESCQDIPYQHVPERVYCALPDTMIVLDRATSVSTQNNLEVRAAAPILQRGELRLRVRVMFPCYMACEF